MRVADGVMSGRGMCDVMIRVTPCLMRVLLLLFRAAALATEQFDVAPTVDKAYRGKR